MGGPQQTWRRSKKKGWPAAEANTPPPPNSVIVESCLFSLGCGENCCEKIGSELFGAPAWKLPFPLILTSGSSWRNSFPLRCSPAPQLDLASYAGPPPRRRAEAKLSAALFPLVPLPSLFQSPPSCSPMHFKTHETEASLAVLQSSRKTCSHVQGTHPSPVI